MYLMASPTVWIFSASSSGMFRSNSSSNSITSSTVSRESAPRSLMKEVASVILSRLAPICSQTMSSTFSRMFSLAATPYPPVSHVEMVGADNVIGTSVLPTVSFDSPRRNATPAPWGCKGFHEG